MRVAPVNRAQDLKVKYQAWIEKNEPSARPMSQWLDNSFPYAPTISIVMPVFNPPLDALRAALTSCLDQTYRNLELCIANGGTDAGVRRLLDETAALDPRVRLQHIPNGGISRNTNAAMLLADGEFIALMDHDDTLAPFALYAIVERLNKEPGLDIIYSDEDRLNIKGERCLPFLKPDWSPELLHSFMYVGHLTVYSARLLDLLGGFDPAFDGSQDYDMILRAMEVTKNIGHIPQVLYHWRMLPASASMGGKPDARVSNIAALDCAMRRRGYEGQVAALPHSNRFEFSVPSAKVSIIIPSDDLDNINACLDDLYGRTNWTNTEVLVVTNSLVAAQMPRRDRLRVIRFDEPFNFSKKCNVGAAHATGDYLVFYNDDVSPLTPNWVESLMEYAQQPEIGGVSPKLVHENDTIQYAGMVVGVRDLVGTAFHSHPRNDSYYSNMAISVRNVSVLSGACMMVRTSTFREVGGWDEVNTPVFNSDLDFSFKLREKGLRLVYTPFAELRHIGHKSLGVAAPRRRLADLSLLYMFERWGQYVGYDPYFPPNMRDLIYYDARGHAELRTAQAREIASPAKARMSVLLVSHDLSLSGAPIILFEIARYLQLAGVYVMVIAPEDGPMAARYQADGIQVIIDPDILTNPFKSTHLMSAFDLIVPNTVKGWHVVSAAKSIGKPCVWLIQESQFGAEYIRRDPPRQKSFTLADAILFPSRSTVALYDRFMKGPHLVPIHYGISEPLTAGPPPFLPNPTRLNVVHVGSVEPRKGQDVVLAALRTMPAVTRPEVFFLGRFLDEAYSAKMRTTAMDMPNVHFLGEVPRETALNYIRHADLLVCTSREETGPIVVMEAMALGTAVISSPVGSANEIIDSGKNGIICGITRPDDLARHFTLLTRQRDRLKTMATAGRQTYATRLQIARYGKDVLGIFKAAIDGVFTTLRGVR